MLKVPLFSTKLRLVLTNYLTHLTQVSPLVRLRAPFHNHSVNSLIQLQYIHLLTDWHIKPIARASPVSFIPNYPPARQGKYRDSAGCVTCDRVWPISCFQQVIAENQLFAATARANVTAQPAATIIISAKIMYLSFTSVKKRSIK